MNPEFLKSVAVKKLQNDLKNIELSIINGDTSVSVSDKVILARKEYCQASSESKNRASFLEFFSSRMRIDRESYDYQQESISDIWRSYRYWHESNGAHRKLSQIDLIKYLEIQLGKPINNMYYPGVVVFNTSEDIQEYDAVIALKIELKPKVTQ